MAIDGVLNYNYDALADVLYMYLVDNLNHEEGVELDNNTFLTLDKNGAPVALEILDASKVLSIPNKLSLKRIKSINLDIKITKDFITVYCILNVPIHSSENIKSSKSVIANVMGLPVINTELAMV
ncbi:MAG: DUF2283 domain-containing protein [Methanobacteriaceae archaeon]